MVFAWKTLKIHTCSRASKEVFMLLLDKQTEKSTKREGVCIMVFLAGTKSLLKSQLVSYQVPSKVRREPSNGAESCQELAVYLSKNVEHVVKKI